MNYLAELSPEQIDRLLDMGRDLLALLTTVIVTWLAVWQTKNKNILKEEIRQNTEISKQAFEVANGHNDKIVQLTQRVTDVASKAVEHPANPSVVIVNPPTVEKHGMDTPTSP